MALIACCPTSCSLPAPPQRGHDRSRMQTRQRTIVSAAQQQQQAAGRPAALGHDSSTSGAPLALLLSVVQLLAALQLVLLPQAVADSGDFTIHSEPAADDTEEQYFETVPQGLNSADSSTAPRLGALIEGPKGKQVQQCVRTCMPTCLRGGQGSPGLGPMTIRKETVVFKEGYRSRSYCLSECTQVCALTINPPAKAGSPEVGK